MPRSFGVLMVVVMLAALVPLTASAAKPVPVIGQITAVSLNDTCEVQVIAYWEGRAFEV